MSHEKMVNIFKALADNTRLDIVRRLRYETTGLPSCDLVSSCSNETKLSQPAMSHHFGKLVDAEILVERKVGTEKYYQLNKELLESVGINYKKI